MLAAWSVAGPPAKPIAIVAAIGAAIGVSLAVETMQLQMADRTASIVDILAAAAGAALGAVCPLCVVATPALLGLGVVQKLRARFFLPTTRGEP